MDDALKLSIANAGIKFDQNKPDLSIVPAALDRACARVLTFGANKYGRNNYRKGIDYTRILAALLRHAKDWNEGQHFDPESGLSHLDHIVGCAAMLTVMEESPKLSEKHDDRDLHANSQISKSGGSSGLAAGLLPGGDLASGSRFGDGGAESDR